MLRKVLPFSEERIDTEQLRRFSEEGIIKRGSAPENYQPSKICVILLSLETADSVDHLSLSHPRVPTAMPKPYRIITFSEANCEKNKGLPNFCAINDW